jgi:hypothetical protein
VLSLTGERKVDVLLGTSTGFDARGFSNGPSIQSRADCAPTRSEVEAQSEITTRKRAAARRSIGVGAGER